jgi:hypothetical protein
MRLIFSAILFLSISLAHGQVRISNSLPVSGRGGEFIKNHAGPNSVFFAPPYGENMHQTYFYVCLERIQAGTLKVMLEYEAPYKVPAFAVYKIDEGEWQYTKMTKLAQYEIEIPEGSKKCYFASGIPFTYKDLLSYVDDLPDTYASKLVLDRKSNEGRNVPIIKITDPEAKDEYKQLVWVISGQHTFELPGIHTVKGMIDFLLSDHPEAVALRKLGIYYFCPIVDVDASDNGKSGKKKVGRGTNAYPLQDFNWDWNVELNSQKPIKNTQGGPNAYNNISHPQVKSLQEFIYSTSLKNPLRIFLDSHSPWPDEVINDTSALHVIDKYLPRSNRSYRNPQSYARVFWKHYESQMGFKPVVLQDEAVGNLTSASGRRSYTSSFGPDEQYDYERSADYWVDSENSLYYRNTLAQPNIFFSATLETGWHYTPKDSDGERRFWTIEELGRHSKALCHAMYQMMSPYEYDRYGDIITDITPKNQALQFKGNWNVLEGILPNTPMHYHQNATMTTTETGSSVRIPLSIPYSGIYDVFNWHNPIIYSAFEPKPNHILNDDAVQITIFNGEEYFTISSDQSKVGGAWEKLTTLYLFKDKRPAFIEIKKVSSNNKVVQADAIRLSPSLGLAAPEFSLR